MTSRLNFRDWVKLAAGCLLAAVHPLEVEAEISGLHRLVNRPIAGQADLHRVATSVTVVTRRRTVTGLFLLQRSRQAIAYVSETSIVLSRQGTLHSTPLLVACARAARALQAVDQALASHKGRAFAAAMAASSSAIGRLDATYRLAALSDRKLQQGMRTLDVAWRAFARDAGRGVVATSQQRIANSRRIASLRRRLVALRTRRAQSATEVTQIDYLISGLDRASRANRSPGYQWLALGLFDEMAGQFSGYYDYLSMTDPLTALAYRSDYAFASREEGLFADEFMSSYGAPAWSQFGDPYAVADDPAFGASYPLLDEDLDASAARMEQAADDAGGTQSLAEAEAQAASDGAAQDADPASEADAGADALADQPADTTDLRDDAPVRDDDSASTASDAGAPSNDDSPGAATEDDRDSAAAANAGESGDADAGDDEPGVDQGASGDDGADDDGGEDGGGDDGSSE